MKKKLQSKKRSHTIKRKTGNQYLRLSVLAVVTAVVTFCVGSQLTKQPTVCANSGTCQTDLTEHIDNNATGTFQGTTILPPQIDLARDNNLPSVLGANTPDGEKHIYVDLATQQLYAYQGNTQVMQTFIASGKWNPTPVGNFHIWEKLRATRMSGGEGADAYDLPNVPYVMYFFHDFGLHGAYWHNNFGHMMSHGCVNMRIVDARDLFNWADGPTQNNKGTAVSVCNSFTAPNQCVQENPISD